MSKSIFITGTDTGVGKTVVTGLLGRFLLEKGSNAVTQKWVQTGCSNTSEDIETHLTIMRKTSLDFPGHLGDMSPYVFKYPASPHLASELEGESIDVGRIKASFGRLSDRFDAVLVEGAGGIMVPVGGERMIVDIAEELELPTLIVSGNRLGAINQTLLTVEALRKREIDILGIVFNRSSPGGDEKILRDNPGTVERLSGAKVLGELPYREDMEGLYGAFREIGDKVLAASGCFNRECKMNNEEL